MVIDNENKKKTNEIFQIYDCHSLSLELSYRYQFVFRAFFFVSQTRLQLCVVTRLSWFYFRARTLAIQLIVSMQILTLVTNLPQGQITPKLLKNAAELMSQLFDVSEKVSSNLRFFTSVQFQVTFVLIHIELQCLNGVQVVRITQKVSLFQSSSLHRFQGFLIRLFLK